MTPGGHEPEGRAASTNSLIALAVRRPVGLLMIATAIFVFGLLSLDRLPMDLMPEINYPTLTVRTSYAGAAPEDVEDRVSRRLEQALSVVRNLRRISSVSRAETSDVILEFTWGTEMKEVVQDVREKLDQTFLPDDVETPTILRYDPSLDPVLQVGLVGSLDLKALRLLAEEEVERRLETVEGVAAAKVRGGLEEEIRVLVEEEKIRSRGITLEEIARRLREENLDQASGLLREGNVSYVVRTRNELRGLEEMGRVPIRREGDSVIRLADLARIEAGHKEREVITRIDGRPAVKIDIYREAGANIIELADRVRERLLGTPEERSQLERWKEGQRQRFEGTYLADEDEEKDESGRGEEGGGDEEAGEVPAEKKTAKPPGTLARPDYVAAHLPEDVDLRILSDQSVFISGAIRDLRQTALLGGILAIFVLFFFLGRVSYTGIVALAIPFSVVATFAPMFLGGISLNIMSLGGLALGIGMLVDSSIVVLESIFRRREEGRGTIDSAVEGASEVGGAVFASTLTTVAVFFPIVFVEGIAGQVFRDQALTVVFSLLASLLVSLSLIPMLAARLRPPGSREGRGGRLFWRPVTLERVRAPYRWARGGGVLRWVAVIPGHLLLVPYWLLSGVLEVLAYLLYGVYLVVLWLLLAVGGLVAMVVGTPMRLLVRAFGALLRGVERAYLGALSWSLSERGVVLVVVLATVLGAGYLIPQLGTELIPEVAQGEFEVTVRYPVGTPLAATEARVRAYEARLGAVPGVASVGTTIGVDSEDIEDSDLGEHTARFRVRLERSQEEQRLVEERVLDQYDRILGEVTDHTREASRPALFSFRTPVEVEVKGYNLERLRSLGLEVERILREVPGLKDVRSTVARGNPEYHLRPDREKLARYGVTSQQISEVLRAKNIGDVASRLRVEDRKIDIRVQLREEDRDSLESLLGMMVASTPAGHPLTLADLVVRQEVQEGPSEIRRIDNQRAVVVSASLTGLDLGRVSQSLEERLFRDLDLPPEFTVDVTGQKREMERSRNSLIGALVLAIFLVYVVMASQFESLLQPFIILFTIPLAAVGVIATLYLVGVSISIMAFIGMIMLAGIVVNNAIVLIDQINRLRDQGLPLRESILEGGRRRLRPILMTTATTVLAMIPVTGILARIPHEASLDFLLGSGEGAEIRSPLAWTVIGGLLSSTFLTLIVVPVVYSLLGGFASRWREASPR